MAIIFPSPLSFSAPPSLRSFLGLKQQFSSFSASSYLYISCFKLWNHLREWGDPCKLHISVLASLHLERNYFRVELLVNIRSELGISIKTPTPHLQISYVAVIFMCQQCRRILLCGHPSVCLSVRPGRAPNSEKKNKLVWTFTTVEVTKPVCQFPVQKVKGRGTAAQYVGSGPA